MKKIILLAFLLSHFAMAQDNYELKYWVYRNRFNQKFILRGTAPDMCTGIGGYSIPWSTINDNNNFNAPHIGDGPMNMGWYLGLLSTEYYLLVQGGETNLDDLKLEIYQAFKAIERLDRRAETYMQPSLNIALCYSGATRNGFLLRDDAKEDFFETYYNAKRLEGIVPDLSNYTSPNQPYNIGIEAFKKELTVSDCKSNCDQTDPTFNKMSEDHMVYLMMGCSLANKYLKGVSYNGMDFAEEAKTNVSLMVNYFKDRGWVLKVPMTNDFQTYQELGGHQGSGADWDLQNGIDDAANKVTGASLGSNQQIKWDICQNILLKKPVNGCPDTEEDLRNEFKVQVNNGGFFGNALQLTIDAITKSQYIAQLISNEKDPINDFTTALTATLGAMAGSWRATDVSWGNPLPGGCNNTYSALYRLMKEHKDVFHILLYDVLHGKSIDGFESRDLDNCTFSEVSKSGPLFETRNKRVCILGFCWFQNYYITYQKNQFPGIRSEVEAVLNSAPWDGPQKNMINANDLGPEMWNVSNRFEHYKKTYYDFVPGTKGEMSGIDFMLLHNLYKIAKGDNSMRNRLILTDNSQYPSAITKTIRSLNDMTVTASIADNSNIHYVANHEIKFLEGFSTGSNTEMVAEIKDVRDESYYLKWNGRTNRSCKSAVARYENNIFDEPVGAMVINHTKSKVYPNPTKESLYVSISDSFDSGFIFELTSIEGQKILERNYEAMEYLNPIFRIDLPILPTGTYLYSYYYKDKIEHGKIQIY